MTENPNLPRYLDDSSAELPAPRSEGPPQASFYTRHSEDPYDQPTIMGRRPTPSRQCQLCMVVRNLTMREDEPYSFNQATWVEYDILRMIYSDFRNKDIVDYLRQGHGYEVRSDTITTHRRVHIPNPELVRMEKIRRAAERKLDPEDLEDALRLPYMVIDKVLELLREGAIDVKVRDALASLEFLKGLRELRDRDEEQREFMAALDRALLETFPDGDERRELLINIHKELQTSREVNEIVQ